MADGYDRCNNELNVANLCRYVGQTVTIFTTSGGLSGSGFTGLLLYADNCVVKLLTNIGAAPACPLGSNCAPIKQGCDGGYGGYGRGYDGYNDGFGGGFGYGRNPLGSVAIIPTDRIVSFVHNAI